MAKIERFEDLDLWKKATAIGVETTSSGKLIGDYSAKNRLKGAVISILNNTAQGFEYKGKKNFVRLLGFSKNSAGELRSQLFVLKEAEVVLADDYENLKNKLVSIFKNIGDFYKNYLRKFESILDF